MKKILIVEDSDSTRAMMRAIVEDMGENFLVFEASNGFEALKILPTENFNLIITDINMPDINGLELINFIKTTPQYSKIPLIIVTTERTEEDRRRGMALGANDYITKPFEPEQLRESILNLLDR
ncbi:MAG: response regulator [Nitrospirae bacterium]|nr:MAG: response regulator [Nitrospirota bacterium]